ncbi:MAG TPA: hypothetical protein PLP27_05580 [Crocinitomicaceae bacterium]|nr:hypothetical protein [Crocinitomicaceae bacterium]
MILARLFKRKKKTEQAPVLKGQKPKFLGRTAYKYKAQCALTFNGEIIRTFDTTIKGYSRKQAVDNVNKGFKVEVTKIHRLKA